jgi:hypothetical protein
MKKARENSLFVVVLVSGCGCWQWLPPHAVLSELVIVMVVVVVVL